MISSTRLGRYSQNHALADDPVYDGESWSSIEPVSAEEVTRLIASLPVKTSPLDYLPTSLLKAGADLFGSIIATLANKSFLDGSFPGTFKSAQVKPLLKKSGLDPDNPSNYRPISNLNTISKILERLFLSRLRTHVSATGNFNSRQSGFRPHHSTETALQSILNDIYRSIDTRKLTLLVALDISAAFDALEHDILLKRLEHTFGIKGCALNWIRSYLSGRTQFVKVDDSTSEKYPCLFGVPQGSVLGPILFALHVSPIANVIEKTGLQHHQYADDTQLYISFKSTEKQPSVLSTERAVEAVRRWFIVNGLQLNPDKTEAIFLGTTQNLSSISDCETLNISGSVVKLADQVKSLGVIVDSRLSFDAQISSICKASYFHIKALRKIRSALDMETAKAVACSIVTSRIDYCNSLFYGMTARNFSKLQRIQNTVARIVSGIRRFDHITPVLKELHWLPVRERVDFKIGCMTFKALRNKQPTYLADVLHSYVPARSLRSSSMNNLEVPFVRTKIATRAFSVAAPAIWNSLPFTVRSSDTFQTFRKGLKSHLFDRAY